MFYKKKQSETFCLPKIQQPKIQDKQNIDNLNHQFFLLVRDQKYEEALAIGQLYLSYHPQSQSVRKFCQFIEGNRQQLVKMVQDQQNYTDGSSEDEQDESDSDGQDDKQSVCSSVSAASSSKSSISSQSQKSSISTSSKVSAKKTVSVKGKQNGGVCKVHKWQHVCKQKNCPNKK